MALPGCLAGSGTEIEAAFSALWFRALVLGQSQLEL